MASETPNDPNFTAPLSPLYKPAERDTILHIRFVGNTAIIGDLAYEPSIDPFQMLAASEFIKVKAHQMIAQSEMQALQAMEEEKKARGEIVTAGRIPDDLPPPGS